MMVKIVFLALNRVFSQIKYLVSVFLIAVVISTIALLWTNFSILRYAWLSETTSWYFASSLAVRLLSGTAESLGWFTVGMIGVLSLLIAIIICMTWYAWRNIRLQGVWRRFFSTTGPGMVAALFGIGCAVCGSMLLASLLALFGAAGILLLLPFHGAELSFLAVGLLLYALVTVAKVIAAPRVC